MVNDFSPTWFATFLSATSAAPVDREIEFVQTHLPLAEYPRLLDVPCGIGRHANPLAKLGYEVVGIDRSDAAIDVARSADIANATYRCADLRDLGELGEAFDGLLSLWASFGYGEAEENRKLFRAMVSRLRPGGRLVLDVYNREALRLLPAHDSTVRAGRTVTTRRELDGARFRVDLEYSDSTDTDSFDWEVFTPSELRQLASSQGLEVVLICAWFDAAIFPSFEHQRMQALFEKPTVGADA